MGNPWEDPQNKGPEMTLTRAVTDVDLGQATYAVMLVELCHWPELTLRTECVHIW